MSAGIYCTFHEKERRWASSESTKGNIPTHGSTMKDGCEYVSGIENTGEEFHFILANFNFLFLLHYDTAMNSPEPSREYKLWENHVNGNQRSRG